MITSLFDWFHQPFIISLPKLFHQRRQHCVIGICKDKRPERHLPITHPVPMGKASQPLGTSRSRGQWGMSPCCQNQPCLHSKELHSLYMRCGCSNPAAQASPWWPPPQPQLPPEGVLPPLPCLAFTLLPPSGSLLPQHPRQGTETPCSQPCHGHTESQACHPAPRLCILAGDTPTSDPAQRGTEIEMPHPSAPLTHPRAAAGLPAGITRPRPPRQRGRTWRKVGHAPASQAAAGERLARAGGRFPCPHRAGDKGNRGETRGIKGR